MVHSVFLKQSMKTFYPAKKQNKQPTNQKAINSPVKFWYTFLFMLDVFYGNDFLVQLLKNKQYHAKAIIQHTVEFTMYSHPSNVGPKFSPFLFYCKKHG